MRQESESIVAPAPRRRAGGYPSLLRRLLEKIFPWFFGAEGAMQTTKKTKVAACARIGMQAVTKMQTRTAAPTQLKRLAQTAIDGLCRKGLEIKAHLQDRACCMEWRYDCPFHTTAEVTRALQLAERLKDLRLRLAMALGTQKECS